jgi:predicted Zn-dependent protease
VEREVNVSPEHPLQEFAVLVGGLTACLVAAYIALGFAVDLVVPRIGPSLEEKLGNAVAAGMEKPQASPAGRRLQDVLDTLTERMAEKDRAYAVSLMKAGEANAMALPGGRIIVMSQLVKEAQSENEIAMVLGHELGHFANRDHLRGLGRGLVLVFLAVLFTGADSAVSGLAETALGGTEMQFSQKQELEADAFGLELLVEAYGHAGGATAFFERMLEGGESRLKYFFASHPYPAERVAALRKTIAEKGYAVGRAIPLDDAFRDFEDEKKEP